MNEIRSYCSAGHTKIEAAEHFGLKYSTVKEICKGICTSIGNQWSVPDYDRIARIVSERTDFEYVGNYTGSEGTADIKCKTCGDVKTVAWTSIKHNSLICRKCEERERIRKQQEKQAEKDAKKERMRLQAEVARALREEKQKAIEEGHRIKNKKCTQCGRTYSYNDCKSNKFCSKLCGNRARNKAKELRRRIKISAQMIDHDISIERLYERDGGICYLCGRVCDWNDKRGDGINNAVICGNTYPSIDHVVPLAKGGSHSWANVKLACRGCNSVKSDNVKDGSDQAPAGGAIAPRSPAGL